VSDGPVAGAKEPAVPAAVVSLRYTRVAIALHWACAALILLNLPLGLVIHLMEESAFDQALTDLHKPLGISVLALALLRLGWRLSHRLPPLPGEMRRWERAGAHIVHWLLYFLMIAVPLAGWVMSSSFGSHPISFGLFDVPLLPFKGGMPQAVLAHDFHQWLGIALAAVAVGHIAAALRHRFLLRDGVTDRMSIFPRRTAVTAIDQRGPAHD